MKVITESDLRANMENVFEMIEGDADDLVVTRIGRESLVVIAQER